MFFVHWDDTTETNDQYCWRLMYRNLSGGGDNDDDQRCDDDDDDNENICDHDDGDNSSDMVEGDIHDENEIVQSDQSDVSEVVENELLTKNDNNDCCGETLDSDDDESREEYDENDDNANVDDDTDEESCSYLEDPEPVQPISHFTLPWKQLCLMRHACEVQLPCQSTIRREALHRLEDSIFDVSDLLRATNGLNDVYWHNPEVTRDEDAIIRSGQAQKQYLTLFVQGTNFVVRIMVLHDRNDSSIFMKRVTTMHHHHHHPSKEDYQICMLSDDELPRVQLLSKILGTSLHSTLHPIAVMVGCYETLLDLPGALFDSLQ